MMKENMTQLQLVNLMIGMKAKGYKFVVWFENHEMPYFVKKTMDVGPLMREVHPDSRIKSVHVL